MADPPQRNRASGGIARWVAPALLLHAGVVMVAAALGRWAGADVRAVVPASSLGTSSPPSELIELASSEPIEVINEVSPVVASSARRVGATRTLAANAASEPEANAASEPGAEPELASDATADVARSEPPRLSLEQLGAGLANPFRNMSFERPVEPSPEQRLQASLQHDSLEADRRRSLGPEGPVIEAARRLALARDTLVEARAVLSVRSDAQGRVIKVEVLEGSGPVSEWQRLADDLLKSLAGVLLRLPASQGGTELQLQIVSALRLPSGADPGLRLDLFGQTLSEGAGPRSASLSLSPKAPLQKEQAEDTAGRHRDSPLQFEVGLLELRGDVSDIAARPRRVVEVSLLPARSHAPL